MTDFSLNDGSKQTVWSKKYLAAYSRKSPYAKDMKTANAPIRTFSDLSKYEGDALRTTYFGNLSGSGVSGKTDLEGNEEALSNYSIEVRAELLRNGVNIHKADQFKTHLELANIAGQQLQKWSKNTLTDDINDALVSVPVKSATAGVPDTTVAYGSASTANKNAFNTANADRLVFAGGQLASGTMSSDLATITATDVMSAATLDAAIAKAKATTSFEITPYGMDESLGREYFIYYCDSLQFAHLRNDETIKANMQQAWARDEMTNPLFRGGDLHHNGAIIREVPSLKPYVSIGAVGATSAEVTAGFLCGVDTVAIGWAQTPMAVSNDRDYGAKKGVGIEEIRGVKKMSVNGVQVGMVTVFSATGN